MNVDNHKTDNNSNFSEYHNSSYLPNQPHKTNINPNNKCYDYNNNNKNNNNNSNTNYSKQNNNYIPSTLEVSSAKTNFEINKELNSNLSASLPFNNLNVNSDYNLNYNNNNKGKRIYREENNYYLSSNASRFSNTQDTLISSGQNKKIKIENIVDNNEKDFTKYRTFSNNHLSNYHINSNNNNTFNEISKVNSSSSNNFQQTTSLSLNYSLNYQENKNNSNIPNNRNNISLNSSNTHISTDYYRNPRPVEYLNRNNNTISHNNYSLNTGKSYQQLQQNTYQSTHFPYSSSNKYNNNHINKNNYISSHITKMAPSIQTSESNSAQIEYSCSEDMIQSNMKRKSLSKMSIDNITNNDDDYQKDAKKINNSDDHLSNSSKKMAKSPNSFSTNPIANDSHPPSSLSTVQNSEVHNEAKAQTPASIENHNQKVNTTINSSNNKPSGVAVTKKVNNPTLSIPKTVANSNSCIYLPKNFYEVEINHLIYLIAEMLEKLTKYNDQITLTKENLTRFHSRKAPEISIYDYLKRIVKYAAIDKVALLSLLIYIDRICKRHRMFTISSLTVHRFIITSLTCASKAMCDSICTNTHYSKGK